MRYTRSSEESKGSNIHGFENPRMNETYDSLAPNVSKQQDKLYIYIYLYIAIVEGVLIKRIL